MIKRKRTKFPFSLFALILIGSCEINEPRATPPLKPNTLLIAERTVFDSASEQSEVAEAVFVVFCASYPCWSRSEYEMTIIGTEIMLSLEFKRRKGVEFKTTKNDYFSCSVAATALYCDEPSETPLLKKDDVK